jgi:eukaryotic-like serine/threonine-protein kinase
LEDTVDPSRWPEADALLDQALALPPHEREPFVRRAAASDADLQAAVLAILHEASGHDAFLLPGGALDGPLLAEIANGSASPLDDVLTPGTVLGSYRVVGPLGRGGMGEVYRALDMRLGREVALKILPGAFAKDAERLARFEREARMLASIAHPKIGAIYDIEDTDVGRALVLELVEGPTLADRLADGPLPIDQALGLARDVAEALEAAHQRAIVHRDLKPANIKITPDGARVLDFGIAKALRPDQSGEVAPLTTAVVRPGAVMGTAAYMSPEQARGQRVDHRADIWAFGCLLFEMLTGERAFTGDSTTEVLACILEREPDLSKLPPDAPPAVRRLVRRCLQKQPRHRLGWIGDALLELDERELAEPDGAQRPGPGRWGRRVLPAIAAGGVLGAAAMAAFGVRNAPPADVPPTTRLAVVAPASDQLVAGDLSSVAFAREGRVLVYRARRDGALQLFRRALHDAVPQPIPGTENAVGPFVSDSGRSVAFSRDGLLHVVSLRGGPPVSVTEVAGAVSGAWLGDEAVVFGGETTGGLQRVAASGGAVTPLTKLDGERGDQYHGLPEIVPGGRAVLFTIWSRGRPQLASLDLGSREVMLIGEGRQPRFIGRGHVAFLRENAVLVVPFDAERLRTAGEPVAVMDDVDTSALSGTAHYATALDGTFVYLPRRESRARARSLVWVDRSGREEVVGLETGPFTRASLSPDGSRIALSTAGPDNRDIWVYAQDRGTLTRLTFDDAIDSAPVWTPDGQHVIFRSDRDGGGLFGMRADGAGGLTRLTRSGTAIHTPYIVTADGTVLYTAFGSYRDQSIRAVRLDEPFQESLVLDGPGAQVRPALSPNGRWIAYQSDESGRFEIYVRPYPEVHAARWQVSIHGGTSPHWTAGGRELLFHHDGAIRRVSVETSSVFRAGVPEIAVPIDLESDRLGPLFEVAPDGQRLLFIRQADGPDTSRAPAHFSVVQHWRAAGR